MHLGDFCPCAIGGEAGRAEMIAKQIGQCTACPHGDARCARKVIFGDDSICDFIVHSHEDGGDGAEASGQHGLDALPIAVPSTHSG